MASSLDLFGVPRKAWDEDNSSLVSDYLDGCDGLHHPSGELGDAISFDSIEHGEIKVDLIPVNNLKGFPGNLVTTVPSIEVTSRFPNGGSFTLTWEEARKLCAALWQVTNVAEFG